MARQVHKTNGFSLLLILLGMGGIYFISQMCYIKQVLFNLRRKRPENNRGDTYIIDTDTE